MLLLILLLLLLQQQYYNYNTTTTTTTLLLSRVFLLFPILMLELVLEMNNGTTLSMLIVKRQYN